MRIFQNTYVSLLADMILTRRILSAETPSRAAKLLTRFVVKNADGVVAGKPKVRMMSSEIFKSMTVTPLIKNVATCAVLNEPKVNINA